MISDRYQPDADGHDEYDLARPVKHAVEHSRAEGKSREHQRHKHDERRHHKEAADEDVEDGEILDAADAGDGAAANGSHKPSGGEAKASNKHRWVLCNAARCVLFLACREAGLIQSRGDWLRWHVWLRIQSDHHIT